MAKQMGLTLIVLVILMITVEIDAENRFQSITTTRKGGPIYPSTKSQAESPLTMPPLPAKSQHLQYRGGYMQSDSRFEGIQSEYRGGSMKSESMIGGIQSENRGGSMQSENRGESIKASVESPTPAPSRMESPLALPPIVPHAVNPQYRYRSGQLVVTVGRASL